MFSAFDRLFVGKGKRKTETLTSEVTDLTGQRINIDPRYTAVYHPSLGKAGERARALTG